MEAPAHQVGMSADQMIEACHGRLAFQGGLMASIQVGDFRDVSVLQPRERLSQLEYAKKRTRDHIARFTYLYRALGGEVMLEEPIVRDFEWRDNIFPAIDYRVYK